MIPLALAALLLVTLRLSRRPLPGKTWLLLRCLFPSWRFFEGIEPGASLTFRVAALGGSFGPWQEALPPPSLGAFSVVLNASGNLTLASQSIVEQLLDELDGTPNDTAKELVAYRLVQRLVETRMTEVGVRSAQPRYQFRIAPALAAEAAFFVSDEHAA